MAVNNNKGYINRNRNTQTTGAADQPVETTATEEQPSPTLVEESVPEVTAQEVQPEVTEAPVQAKPEPTVKPTPAKQGNMDVYKVESELTSYMEAMLPSAAVNPEVGGKWQFSLLTLIKSILQTPEQDAFNVKWGTLLSFFHKYEKELFNMNYAFRFPQNWPGSDAEFTLFRRVVMLAIMTADPKTRKKEIKAMANLDAVTSVMSEDQKARLLSFYGA